MRQIPSTCITFGYFLVISCGLADGPEPDSAPALLPLAETVQYMLFIDGKVTGQGDPVTQIEASVRIPWIEGMFDDARAGRVVVHEAGPQGAPGAVLLPDDVAGFLARTDTLFTFDEVRQAMVMQVQEIRVLPEEVQAISFRERWFHDADGRLHKEVLAVAPCRTVRGNDGSVRGHWPLFWIMYK